jgi:ABC-type oligopeptide transport system substrate-binding subunit
MFSMSKTLTIAAAALGTALLLSACGEPAEEETQGSVTPPATEQAPATVAQGDEQKPAQQ